MATRPAYVYNGSGWDDIGDKRIGAEAGDIPQASVEDLTSDLASKLPYSYGTATPTTSDDGFLWYDSNSTPPVPKYWNGSSFANLNQPSGMQLIATDSGSGSSISINDCFSSDFSCYRVVIHGYGSANNILGNIRLRASGSDNTTSNYNRQRLTGEGSSVSAFHATNESSFLDVVRVDGTNGYAIVDFFRPAGASDRTWINVLNGNNGFVGINSGFFNATGAFDGFTVFTSSGTLTLTFLIYGYTE